MIRVLACKSVNGAVMIGGLALSIIQTAWCRKIHPLRLDGMPSVITLTRKTPKCLTKRRHLECKIS